MTEKLSYLGIYTCCVPAHKATPPASMPRHFSSSRGGLASFGGGSFVSTMTDQPPSGFFVAGSSLEQLNGLYSKLSPTNVHLLSAEGHNHLFRWAYRHEDSGWIIGNVRARDYEAIGGRTTEWVIVDAEQRDRFAHTAALSPGSGSAWLAVIRSPPPPPPDDYTKCARVLNHYCNSGEAASTSVGNCEFARSSWLRARFDRCEPRKASCTSASGRQWRCYAPQTLSADGVHFVGGGEYCTRDQPLRLLLERCQSDGFNRRIPALAGAAAGVEEPTDSAAKATATAARAAEARAAEMAAATNATVAVEADGAAAAASDDGVKLSSGEGQWGGDGGARATARDTDEYTAADLTADELPWQVVSLGSQGVRDLRRRRAAHEESMRVADSAPDLYAALGLESSADEAGLRRAYRALSLRHHPDKGGSTEAFAQVSAAYETLSDPEARRRYDEGALPFEPFGNPHAEDPERRHRSRQRWLSSRRAKVKSEASCSA